MKIYRDYNGGIQNALVFLTDDIDMIELSI